VQNGKGRGKAARGILLAKVLDTETMMKLGIWMRVYGSQAENNEGDPGSRRSRFFMCPDCKDAV
jgi:hypothetical protein